ncbi:hypothetical protein RHDC2_00854 [Rhodocyclaceae bacterium]|nr:hypothetical protein RHDC2_00854 [Rhodocyclaceae bacterium]
MPAGSPERGEELNEIAAVKKVKDALEQPAATPTTRLHAGHEPPHGSDETNEKRHAEGELAERRIFCRRVIRQPLLFELRAEADRRRNKQRKDDTLEHVDIEA